MKKRVHYAELEDMQKYIEGLTLMITKSATKIPTLLLSSLQETTTTSIYLWM